MNPVFMSTLYLQWNKNNSTYSIFGAKNNFDFLAEINF